MMRAGSGIATPIERDLEPSVHTRCLCDERGDVGILRHVRPHQARGPARARDLAHRRRATLLADVGDDDVRSIARERDRGRSADPGPGPSHEDDLVTEASAHLGLSFARAVRRGECQRSVIGASFGFSRE